MKNKTISFVVLTSIMLSTVAIAAPQGKSLETYCAQKENAEACKPKSDLDEAVDLAIDNPAVAWTAAGFTVLSAASIIYSLVSCFSQEDPRVKAVRNLVSKNPKALVGTKATGGNGRWTQHQ